MRLSGKSTNLNLHAKKNHINFYNIIYFIFNLKKNLIFHSTYSLSFRLDIHINYPIIYTKFSIYLP